MMDFLVSFDATLRTPIGGNTAAANSPSSPADLLKNIDSPLRTKLERVAANNLPIPSELAPYSSIIRWTPFRVASRSIPEIELPDRKLMRERLNEVQKRVFSHLRLMCKGAALLPPESPRRQLHTNYWLREVVFRDTPHPFNIAALLRSLWRRSTCPSLVDFIKEKESEYQAESESASDDYSFENWLIIELIRRDGELAQQKWCQENPNDDASQVWKQKQLEAIQKWGIPLWALENSYRNETGTKEKQSPPLKFEEWLSTFTINCEKSLACLQQSFGIQLSSKTLAEKQLLHAFSSSPLDFVNWILDEQRNKIGSNEDLKIFVARMHYNTTDPENASKLAASGFENVLTNLKQLHQDAHSPLDFEQWKEIQLVDKFNASPRLTRCTPELRRRFLTTVSNGVLMQGANPLNTSFHYVDRKVGCIFVIGPDQELYCASKVRKVFQHSSFFNGGVVCAAGILTTDEGGNLKTLSNSSGHYRSDEKSDLFMMDYFRRRGVDLSQIQFFIFGSSKSLTAEEYYKDLLDKK